MTPLRSPRRTCTTAAALLAVLTMAACGGDESPAPTEAAPTSATTPAATAPSRVPLSLPTGGFQWRMSIAPDGESALFAHSQGSFRQTRESTIYSVVRRPDGWSDPVAVPFAVEGGADIDPHFSDDGARVWFSSIRPVDGVARTDADVWFVERRPDGSFGEPVHAGAANSPQDDLFPTIGPDGDLYLGSDRGDGAFHLYRSTAGADGSWAAAEQLPAPVTTTDAWEFNPALTPDGSVLVFATRGREGGAGGNDLFFARRSGETWSEPQPLEAVNTSGDEYHPSFSPDGTTMFFVRAGDLLQLELPAELSE